MKPSRQTRNAPGRLNPSPGSRAFSLFEILVVGAVVGLLLALSAPAFLSLVQTRKAGIHELAGFLEHARARAVAKRMEMVVAFADESFPDDDGASRTYALFAVDPPAEGAGGETEVESLRQLTPWQSLPKGLVFGRAEHFEISKGAAFRTLHDLASTRRFPVTAKDGSAGAVVALPSLAFAPDGSVRAPAFADADALHLAIVEGYLDEGTRSFVPTSTRPGRAGGTDAPNGECLAVGLYSGRARILTD